MSENQADVQLLEKFNQEIWSKVPHLEDSKVVNPTPLKEITEDFKECAKKVFKLDIDNKDIKIFGKFDSTLLSGSIKARAATYIIHDAISTGKLKSNQMVIEATSGNFGIALGLLSKLGITVVSLVSRKLQEGVFKELRNENIKIMDLDMDICPAPGMENKANEMAAKATAANVRSQLIELGFEPTPYDENIQEIESLLAKQDIINLARFIAKIYNIFCTKQYDNDLNIEVHKKVTAAEIQQQLTDAGEKIEDYQIFCSFGTGGTSGGLSQFMNDNFNKKSVHIVFPSPGQDVAGIRTRAKATGLKLYNPEIYANEHEIDFEKAKFLLKFFVEKGHDIGESSALELFAVMKKISQEESGRYVVMICDGIEKYRKNFEQISEERLPLNISLDDAAAIANDYDKIIWVHTQYTPKEEGIEMIAKSLGVDKSKISITKARTLGTLLTTQQIPDELDKEMQGDKGKCLLICMAGNTSLMTAQLLSSKGKKVQSLNGGITNLPDGFGKNPGEFVKMATE